METKPSSGLAITTIFCFQLAKLATLIPENANNITPSIFWWASIFKFSSTLAWLNWLSKIIGSMLF